MILKACKSTHQAEAALGRILAEMEMNRKIIDQCQSELVMLQAENRILGAQIDRKLDALEAYLSSLAANR